MDFKKICNLYTDIDDFLKKYGGLSIKNQHLLVKDTIDLLNSSEDDKTKKEMLINSYKSLFTGRGGLTEFCVWDNDFDKRCAINEPFELATDELWKLMKPFI